MDPTTQRFRKSISAFQSSLLPHVNILHSSGNYVYSAFSAFRVLLLTACGSEDQTLSEMLTSLHLSDQTASSEHLASLSALSRMMSCSDIRMAESIFFGREYELRRSFVDLAKRELDALVKCTSFPNPGETLANKWISDKTEGMIHDIVEGTNSSTIAVLINALYFKGAWENAFKVRDTKSGFGFQMLDGSQVPVKMMSQHGTMQLLGYHQIDGCEFQSCTLPYKGRKFSMLFLKPENVSVEGFGGLLRLIESDPELVTKVKRQQKRLKLRTLQIPKYNVETSTSMKEMLMALGMKKPFTRFGDFGKMLMEMPSDGVKIDKVQQVAKMIVDEEGTVAAAVTIVTMGRGGCAPRPTQVHNFILDSPFVCMIVHDRTRCVCFTGVIRKPDVDGGQILISGPSRSPAAAGDVPYTNGGAAEEAMIQSCVDQNCCTIRGTGKVYAKQRWWNCVTCGMTESSGMCESCMRNCHSSHQVVESSESPSPFFCDCFDSPSCLLKTRQLEGPSASSEEDVSYSSGGVAEKARIQDCIQAGCCTIRVTGKVYAEQTWYNCRTCGMLEGSGVCASCVNACHRMHDVVQSEQSPGPFFCDCFYSDRCQLKTKEFTVNRPRRGRTRPNPGGFPRRRARIRGRFRGRVRGRVRGMVRGRVRGRTWRGMMRAPRRPQRGCRPGGGR